MIYIYISLYIDTYIYMAYIYIMRYWKRDEWDDALEKAIAFGLIASHRLKQLDPAVDFGGESLPFVIRLNQHLGFRLVDDDNGFAIRNIYA